MILTWYGHSCFKLDFGQGGSVVFDPYAKGTVPGAELPDDLTSDTVLISHGHHDHNAASRVRLSGSKASFKVDKLETFHDGEKGAKRGPNTVHIVSYSGFRAAHLGDLGCVLSAKELDSLRGLDLLLVPVGGFFTIDKSQAKDIIEAVSPRVTVPMHYRSGSMGFEVLGTLEDFIKEFKTELIHRCGAVLELKGGESGIYVPASPAK